MAMLYTPYQGIVPMHSGAVATGNGTSLDTLDGSNGASSYATIQIEGISGDTITFEGTIDNSTWYALRFTGLTSGTAATTATADGIYQSTLPVLGLLKVRARISTYSAGTIIVSGVAVG